MRFGSNLAIVIGLTLGACALETGVVGSGGEPAGDSATDGSGMDAAVHDVGPGDAPRDGALDASSDTALADSRVDSAAADATVDASGMDASTSGHVTLRVECEDGRLLEAMRAGSAATAFGGAYIDTPPGADDYDWDPGTLPPARAELPLELPRGGTWYLWIRMYGVDGSSDAMHMGFGAADIRRVYPPRTGAWAWVHQTHDGDDDLRFDGLSAGPKTLVVGVGEPGARCDRVILTTDNEFVATEAP